MTHVIKNEKAAIRKNIKSKRLALSSEQKESKSKIICAKLLANEIYKKSKVIYCYSAIDNEVDLTYFIQKALAENKIIALPKVINKNGQMLFVEMNDFDTLQKGVYHILEPVNNEPAPKADLIIVPGIAFTTKGDRIGQAGGFYDRYLENKQAYTIGVCYDFQLFNNLPVECHDIKMDMVITDN